MNWIWDRESGVQWQGECKKSVKSANSSIGKFTIQNDSFPEHLNIVSQLVELATSYTLHGERNVGKKYIVVNNNNTYEMSVCALKT